MSTYLNINVYSSELIHLVKIGQKKKKESSFQIVKKKISETLG